MPRLYSPFVPLLRENIHNAGELAGATALRPAALTHHLTVLKLADLIRVERRGQFQIYSLNTTVFQDLVTELLSWWSDPIEEQTAPGARKGDAQ